jgi:hypothetical protein
VPLSQKPKETVREEAPPKRAIVNLVTPLAKYLSGQNRLRQSLSGAFLPEGTDVYFYTKESEVGAPSHDTNPYAFKIFAIEKVRQMGYDQVLWLDASIIAVKNITPVFDWLSEKEIFLEESGHMAGLWTNDEALAYFGLSRKEALLMPMYSAGYCGFDFRKKVSVDFFERWKEAMKSGAFRGNWADHRHDMSCGSIIASQMKIIDRYSSGAQFFAYVGQGYAPPEETAVFHLIGV